VMVGAPASVDGAASEAGDWIAARLGDKGGRSRVWRT
jgi:23S rRNA (adenine2030-N6)-methyltransferase